MEYLNNLLSISLDAAPWLLLGFVAAGLIKAWIPKGSLNRWLGGKGLWPISKAALIGAPLPLCSCGVLPAATELRRSGASRSSTVSFLIATPETGVDSIALSYVLLGPVMAIIRPIAAIISAISTGLLTGLVPEESNKSSANGCKDSSCGCSSQPAIKVEPIKSSSDCSSSCCGGETKKANTFITRTVSGMNYALVDMVEDLIIWLTLGLLLAALVTTLVPPMAMAEWGSGLPAMLMMLLIGVPMYICATASTPIASALLFAGISPGTVLVFLLAGPATNIATMGIIRQEMGKGVLATYLIGISISAVVLGMLTDWMVNSFSLDIQGQINTSTEWMPEWIALLSGVILLLAAINVLVRKSKVYFANNRAMRTPAD